MSCQRQKSTLLALILLVLLAAGGWPAMYAVGHDPAGRSAVAEPGLAQPEHRRVAPRLEAPNPDGAVSLIERALTGLSAAAERSPLPPIPDRLRPMLEALVQRWAPFYAALERLRLSPGPVDGASPVA
jgi:hypothetical protein